MIDGNNLAKAKTFNQSAIRKIIYHTGPISRQEIADQLSLTLPTITTNVARLISQGLLTEIDDELKSEPTSGRPTKLVAVNPDSRFFMGIEFRGIYRRIVVTNYRGKIICCSEDDTFYDDYSECVEAACAQAETMLDDSGMTLDDISGIGICSPGLVDSPNGILLLHSRYNWADKDLRTDFSEQLSYAGPVSVENNSCARAYTIYMFDSERLRGGSYFAYLMVGRDIGCPLLHSDIQMDNPLVAFGEIGHTVIVPDGRLCRCGNHGCLEAYASGESVARRCLDELDDSPVLKEIRKDHPITLKDVVRAQAEGDEPVGRIVEEAVSYLGIAIANIENFIRPENFFIDCEYFSLESNRTLLLNTIRKNIYTEAIPDSQITFISPNRYSGAAGAAAVAINHDLTIYVE